MPGLAQAFEWSDDAECLRLLERLRWPQGVECPWCGSNLISRFSVKAGVRENRKAIPVRRLYDCLNPGCRHQFSVTSGTVMHNTRVPVWKWLVAISLQINSSGKLGARELQHELRVSYKTAWSMTHRIREAMEECGLVEVNFDPRRKPPVKQNAVAEVPTAQRLLG